MQKSIFSELNPNISVTCVTIGFANDEIKVLVNVANAKKKKSTSSEYSLLESLIQSDEELNECA